MSLGKVSATAPEPSALYAATDRLADTTGSIRPAPTRPAPYFKPAPRGSVVRSCVDPFIARAVISSPVSVGGNWRKSAIMPATCGAAIEVPEIVRDGLPGSKPLAV